MSDWKRLTKEIPLDRLPEVVISAIHKHIEERNLGSILDETVMCIQTDSVQTKKGLFGKQQTVQVRRVVDAALVGVGYPGKYDATSCALCVVTQSYGSRLCTNLVCKNDSRFGDGGQWAIYGFP